MTNNKAKQNLSAKLANIQNQIDLSKAHKITPTQLDHNPRRFRVQPQNNVTDPNWLTNNLEQTQARVKQLEDKYPLHKVYFNRISHMGWTWIDQMPLDSKQIGELMKLNVHDLNKTFEDALTAHSFELLNANFDDLADSLDKGHAKQVRMIKDLINLDPKYHLVLFNTLFAILEETTIKKYGQPHTATWNYNPALNVVKRITHQMHSDQQRRFGRLLELNELNVVMGLYKYADFNDYTLKTMPYSRHTVEHGRFDPSNLTFTQFMQLVLICRNIAWSLKN
ncbi:hypothetical protein KTE19_10135 [Lentilactobacillus sp. IMAU92037]|uniref:hypothetical protein n=1 Tax=Lentilactobacillus dabitei TaxID=2831523 RepID=UPI001C267049|nr:hypothetical protein [Lentilactobacillus dabitei]MBU9790204.1 hypothetical protein [Lentilactobacillus dabitei]MBV0931047.1 hypothetical protein [Lentilactobacillus dabitei]